MQKTEAKMLDISLLEPSWDFLLTGGAGAGGAAYSDGTWAGVSTGLATGSGSSGISGISLISLLFLDYALVVNLSRIVILSLTVLICSSIHSDSSSYSLNTAYFCMNV